MFLPGAALNLLLHEPRYVYMAESLDLAMTKRFLLMPAEDSAVAALYRFKEAKRQPGGRWLVTGVVAEVLAVVPDTMRVEPGTGDLHFCKVTGLDVEGKGQARTGQPIHPMQGSSEAAGAGRASTASAGITGTSSISRAGRMEEDEEEGAWDDAMLSPPTHVRRRLKNEEEALAAQMHRVAVRCTGVAVQNAGESAGDLALANVAVAGERPRSPRRVDWFLATSLLLPPQLRSRLARCPSRLGRLRAIARYLA